MTNGLAQDRTALIRKMAEPFDIAGQSVIGTSVDGVILFWNAGATALYGWSEHEVLGRNITEVTPSAQGRELAAEIMARLREGEIWSGRFPVRRRNGTEFIAAVRDVPVIDESGSVLGIVGISKRA